MAGLLAVTLAVIASPAPGVDGWRDLGGGPCPEIQADEWLNAGETPSVASLRGEVWLLAFFATWEVACMAEVPLLSRLHDKFEPLGFRVIVISDESPSELRRILVDRGARFWIGSDSQARTVARFSDGHVLIPHHFLVGRDGRVIDDVLPTEARIKKLLWESFAVELGRDLHDTLANARLAYDAGCYGAAWKSAGRYLKDGDESLAADARFLRERVESYAGFWRRFLEADLEQESAVRNHGQLLIFEHRFAGLEASRWAARRKGAFARQPMVKEEQKAWRAFESALRKEMGSGGDPRKLEKAREAYRRVAEAHARTWPGMLALDAAERLGR